MVLCSAVFFIPLFYLLIGPADYSARIIIFEKYLIFCNVLPVENHHFVFKSVDPESSTYERWLHEKCCFFQIGPIYFELFATDGCVQK